MDYFAKSLMLFDDHLIKDSKYWHTTMLEWLKAGNEEHKTAFIFLNNFFQELGILLETKNDNEAQVTVMVC